VDLILQLRASARADKRWADSDAIRDGLVAAGIEVRDTENGVEWGLR
jgi:cysteinyl-tRNA synthetase